MDFTRTEERFDNYAILRFSSDGRPLEHAVREPLKNTNWRLIRRVKMANSRAKAKDMPEVSRARFIAKEEECLDVLEARKTLAMYIFEIKATGNWFGTRFHFPNLIIDSKTMECGVISTTSTIPLKWIGEPERAEDKYPECSPDDQHSTTTTTPRPAPSSDSHNLPSTVGSPATSEGDDDSTTPLPDDSQNPGLYQPERFRPSFSLQNSRPPTDPAITQLALDSGVIIEPNYEGELTAASIRDRTCPKDQNATVYIKHVDPSWTTADILDCIREGGIYKYSRQEPNEVYQTCAVTLTFKHRRAAVSFLHRARNEGLYIKGQEVQVIPSRHHCWGIEEKKEQQTRVLQVEGAAELLDADELEARLHNRIRFTLVKREEWVEDGQKTINFHFESILGQSRAAVAYLRKENDIPDLFWQYAEDPCAIDGN